MTVHYNKSRKLVKNSLDKTCEHYRNKFQMKECIIIFQLYILLVIFTASYCHYQILTCMLCADKLCCSSSSSSSTEAGHADTTVKERLDSHWIGAYLHLLRSPCLF